METEKLKKTIKSEKGNCGSRQKIWMTALSLDVTLYKQRNDFRALKTQKKGVIHMKNYPVYCAIDIDDQHFNIAVLPPDEEHPLLLKSAPTVSALIKKITSKAKGFSISDIRLCYEATYLGFDLYRKLKSKGIHCDVIAPSSIPLPPGKRVKTDRIDSTKLLEYYQKGMVSFVYVPSEEDEMIRNLPRSRALLVKDLSKIKAHMILLCRRMGLDYRKATHKPNANYWTKIHQKWLETQINQLPDHSLLRFNLSTLLGTYRNLEIQVDAQHHWLNVEKASCLNPLTLPIGVCIAYIKKQAGLFIEVNLKIRSRLPVQEKCSVSSGKPCNMSLDKLILHVAYCVVGQ